MAGQHWKADQRLRAEATRLAAQTSTQMNAEFRAVEYDASAEMDELNGIHMQEFAIKALEAVDAQKHIFAQEAGAEVRRRENASYTLVSNLEGVLLAQSLESSTLVSNFEALEVDFRRRLYYAHMECRDYVPRYDEFRSESAFFAPDWQ